MNNYDKLRKFSRFLLRTRTNYPEDISIEVTTRCNFSCKMCFRLQLKIPEQDMSYQNYALILDRLVSPRRINITGLGETLLHPRFLDMISLARRKHPGATVEFITNGYSFDTSIQQEILRSGVYQVGFSLESVERDSDNSEGHPTSAVSLKNIKNFIRLRDTSINKPRVRIQSVISSISQVESIFRFASENFIEEVNFIRLDQHFTPAARRQERIPIDQEREIISRLSGLSRKYQVAYSCANKHNLAMKLASRFDRLCLLAENHIYIDVSGNVLPCCLLRKQIAGNLFTENLHEIWQGKFFANFFDLQPRICQGCDQLKWNYWH
jgi:MoaA/NifB/PqqE/SkfB family radical SAM enzyme